MDTGLITLVNDLLDSSRSVKFKVDLPRIVVIGSQSAGKSSVLERCVGKDFLPRDTGICTRRPLELQLINHETEEYAEFYHCRERKFVDFDAVRQEIIDETDRETQETKCVSSRPICLKVYSPAVPNLTLIDLPGLTQTYVTGQAKDTPGQIRAMVKSYIASPNCLILAVVSACADLATNEALGLAEEVDPKRYVGVINRSQKEIEEMVDNETINVKEARFFHENYSDLAHHQGMPYLHRLLSEHLTSLIRRSIPDLRYKIQLQLAQREEEADDLFKYTTSPRSVLLELLCDFHKNLQNDIEGDGQSVDLKKLSGGTLIQEKFHTWFPAEVNSLKLNRAEMMAEIRTAIKNVRGSAPGMFIPDRAFRAIVRQEIQRLQAPALKSVAEVEHIVNATVTTRTEEMAKFPHLRDEVVKLMEAKRCECSSSARDALKAFIKYNQDYINTENEDFRAALRDNLPEGNPMNPEFEVLWNGYLGLTNPIGGLQPATYWFELTRRTLQWFTDETKSIREHILSLNNLTIGEIARPWLSKPSLELAHALGGHLYKNWEKVCLVSNEAAELDRVKTKLMEAGQRVADPPGQIPSEHVAWSPGLHTNKTDETDIVYDLVGPYMDVIRKSIKDMLPKIISSTFIKEMTDFAGKELSFSLAARLNEDQLMSESDQRKKYREETMETIEMLRRALKRLSETSTQT